MSPVSKDVIQRDLYLDDADGVECLPNEEIFAELAHNLTSQNTKYTSLALTQKVFAIMRRVGKRFLGVETPLFASMLVQPQPQAVEEDKVKVPTAPALPSPKTTPSPPPHDPTPLPYDSTIPLLTTLMEACASLSYKVVELEQDKHTQALEILKLKKRVKKLEKKRRSKHSRFKRLRKVGTSHRVESSTNTIVDEDVSAATKDVSTVEPTVFDDEEVTMTMAQTSIKIKAEKAILFDEQIAQRGMNYDKDKYPIIDWEIYSEGSRTYWKIIRVGGITEAYQSFKDMLIGFNREDLVELKSLFELDADDVLWKLQRIKIYSSRRTQINAASIATTVSAIATITTKEITLAQSLVEIKTSKPKAKGIVLQKPSESTTTTTKIISSELSQDKGKGIMVKEL
nr:hypothetical protein [Tanacetum cinerariifolium]